MQTPLRRLLPLLPLGLSACGIGVVQVKGTVSDGFGGDVRLGLYGPGPALSGAGVDILDEDGFHFDSTTTASDGTFTVDAPPGEAIYALVSRDDGIVAGFTGVSGLQPVLQVEEGSLYGVSDTLRADWLAPFAGCPALDAGGGLAIGIVHAFLPGVDPDSSTIVINATVELDDSNTGEKLDLPVCYLDPATGLYSAEQTLTGDTGWYLIGGVDEGNYILMVEFEISDDLFDRAFIDVWMPPDGMVPRFPTYVEFPTF